MKKLVLIIVGLLCFSVFSGCTDKANIADSSQGVTSSSVTTVVNTATLPEITSSTETSSDISAATEAAETVIPSETEVLDTESGIFHVDGVSEDDMITYFNEVVLDSEVEYGGDSSFVQKWGAPVFYYIHGEYTQEDYRVLTDFVSYLNTIDGFPGMYPAGEDDIINLDIYFCQDNDELVDKMGGSDFYYNLDGAVTFWYDYDVINNGIISYRNDIEQEVRNSVIIEEIYNGLGPVQDTDIRVDSIIYSGYTTPQEITEVDDVILRLLYHSDIKCGMNADECEEVIRNLYY